MKYGDLDPATQRAIRKATAATPTRLPPASPLPRSRRDPFAEPTHRCKECGRTFTEWGPAERHVNRAHGGGVIELTLAGGGRTPQGA